MATTTSPRYSVGDQVILKAKPDKVWEVYDITLEHDSHGRYFMYRIHHISRRGTTYKDVRGSLIVKSKPVK